MLARLLLALALLEGVLAGIRTLPPKGAAVVRAGTKITGEYATIGAALAALPADNSTQSVFIYPGTYAEQVNITRGGPTKVITPPSAWSPLLIRLAPAALWLHVRHGLLPPQHRLHHR
jgi:hypothetical protein